MVRLTTHAVPLIVFATIVLNAQLRDATATCAEDLVPRADANDVLDVDCPESWEQSTREAQRQIDDVTGALIAIAQDRSRTDDDRRKAILVLGTIESDTSLDFLIENVSLRIDVHLVLGDADRLMQTPCRAALQRSGTWTTAQAVLKSLKRERSDQERRYLQSVLRSCLGIRLAIAAVDDAIAASNLTNLTDVEKENLLAVRRLMRWDTSDQIDQLQQKYSGKIKSGLNGDAAAEYATKMQQLMKEWDPRGHPPETLETLAGAPSSRDVSELRYEFDTGEGGRVWVFKLRDGLIREVQLDSLE